MTSYPMLLAMCAVGLSLVVSGAALLLRRVTVSGGLVLGAGLALTGGAVVARTDHALASAAVVLALALLCPVAVATYPVPTWRHPVDFVALVVLVGSGALAVLQAHDDRVVSVLGTTSGFVLIAHTWWRIERAELRHRAALLWMALALAAASLALGFLVFLAEGVIDTAGTVTVAAGVACFTIVGPAMYVGVTRPDVVDVRGLVVRTAVFGVALVCYLALFVGGAALLEVLGSERPRIGVLGVLGALAATTLHPLQVVLRGVVDELLFGRRPDPLGAASQVADRIGEDPVLALRTIRDALVLPYAAIRIDGAELASSGIRVTHTRTLPLVLGADTVGELEVGLRAGDLGLTQADEHVLRLVAPLLAQTLRARTLAADVQASREDAITAIEEERRRLRRDLHDGLGPRLSGIAFTSDAARNTIRQDPDAAEDLLRRLRAETVDAIREIRELVYGMRPPALDELGLVPALRQQAASMRTANGRPLQVALDADDLPELGAAVEVAAYRIVLEALTNAARHSGSDVARARLGVTGGELVVEVRDEGVASGDWGSGVGISSMRERAAELGGTLAAGSTLHGGRVLAALPLGQVSRSGPAVAPGA